MAAGQQGKRARAVVGEPGEGSRGVRLQAQPHQWNLAAHQVFGARVNRRQHFRRGGDFRPFLVEKQGVTVEFQRQRELIAIGIGKHRGTPPPLSCPQVIAAIGITVGDADGRGGMTERESVRPAIVHGGFLPAFRRAQGGRGVGMQVGARFLAGQLEFLDLAKNEIGRLAPSFCRGKMDQCMTPENFPAGFR